MHEGVEEESRVCYLLGATHNIDAGEYIGVIAVPALLFVQSLSRYVQRPGRYRY